MKIILVPLSISGKSSAKALSAIALGESSGASKVEVVSSKKRGPSQAENPNTITQKTIIIILYLSRNFWYFDTREISSTTQTTKKLTI